MLLAAVSMGYIYGCTRIWLQLWPKSGYFSKSGKNLTLAILWPDMSQIYKNVTSHVVVRLVCSHVLLHLLFTIYNLHPSGKRLAIIDTVD